MPDLDPATRVPDETVLAATLTGPDAAEVLGAALGAADLRLDGWHLDSVHHRVGRSWSALYSTRVLDADDAVHDLALVAHLDRRGVPTGPVTVTVADQPVAVWRFPTDPYLPGLPSATSAARVRELLDQLAVPPGPVGLTIRAYRPSRRAVVEVTVAGEAAGRVLYLKVLAGDRAERLARVHRELADHVPVPGVVGVAPAQGILAIRALAGATLRAAIVAGDPVPAPAALVTLSERFAAAPLRSGGDPRRFADPTRHVTMLGALVPDRAADLAAIAAAAAAIDGPLVPVHGDLHDAQLLIAPAGGDDRDASPAGDDRDASPAGDDASVAVVGLLDVDGAGPGHLAHDAGSLVAHLEALGEVWPDADARVMAYAAEVAAAYARLLDPRDLARAAAGAWLGLATGPYRVQDAGWERHTRRRIDRALAWADRAR